MEKQRVSFINQQGQSLSARLNLPAGNAPTLYAVFAHCFTCGKDLTAARHVITAMAEAGIAVLSFDFTGIGESEGNFDDTNFSANLSDLRAAADFLAQNYEAPALLVGHSLGGTAALYVAQQLPYVKAVAVIAAPASPEHLKKLLQTESGRSENNIKAIIGARTFTIKPQFLHDLALHDTKEILTSLHKALLILHAPQDEVVSIQNAADIYEMAHHPKSFISLDGADHLLSQPTDARYVGQMIAAWSVRYIKTSDKTSPQQEDSQVIARIGSQAHKFTTLLQAGGHRLRADEPQSVGGDNLGPSPYDLLGAALAACTAMTMRMYADRKQWTVDEMIVHVNHHKRYSQDCINCEKEGAQVDHFDRRIQITGDLDDAQRTRLLEIADKCPVHKTLSAGAQINTEAG